MKPAEPTCPRALCCGNARSRSPAPARKLPLDRIQTTPYLGKAAPPGAVESPRAHGRAMISPASPNPAPAPYAAPPASRGLAADLRLPVALVFTGTAVAFVQLLVALSHNHVSLFDAWGFYVLGICGLYAVSSLGAILQRWSLFLCTGAALFTVNTAITFGAPGGGMLELFGALSSPCALAWMLSEHGSLYAWNAFVVVFSAVGMVSMWRAIARRLAA